MSITIKHLEGPLKGQEQRFDDRVDTILFGRDREAAQVIYPPEFTVIGRKHFQLRRMASGDYHTELFGKGYVAINGVPAENDMLVKSESEFRLGNKDGPAFKVEIERPKATEELPETGLQDTMSTATSRLTSRVAIGFGALVTVLVALFAFNYYTSTTLEEQIAAANAAAAARAEKEFSEATLARLEAAVYLVAKDEDGKPLPEATAWAFAPNLLATNAHVTQAIMGHEDEFFLVAPDGTHIKIKGVVSHPGYLDFGNFKQTLGTSRYGKFTPLDLINEYDVGIIEIDPSTPLPVDAKTGQPVTLELASQDELEALAPGMAVASAGFPYENIKGSATATKAPPVLHFGFISSLTDVFMSRADPANALLIQHSVPVTGGASGSPLIDARGKVIGIVNGGNTNVIDSAGDGGKVRMSNAVQINYAQRVDLLRELEAGGARKVADTDRAYWDKMKAQFDNLFDIALAAFKDLAASRYKVGEGEEKTLIDDGELNPGDGKAIKLVQQTFTVDAVPSQIYGFIADAESGVPIAINVKKSGTGEFLGDAKDDRQSHEPSQAPTAWVTVTEPTKLDVTVWSLTRLPAKFSLHQFIWAEPKTSETPQADSRPAASQQ
ncbi:trypsin-like serine peptidase [Methyloceanibacter sp.]|uniref:trypsin-like serine peptidase n=1 Tax=Methyloceanibacter sp. TaxID=1965321 RepID=UPI002D39F0F0|nr:trypsin-like peptidase domain-containing protein [Methyloceanibacter sp.]HZP10176.1 trypsin-like peptidase domain-containing protein [Methyloceanibacter sp.]